MVIELTNEQKEIISRAAREIVKKYKPLKDERGAVREVAVVIRRVLTEADKPYTEGDVFYLAQNIVEKMWGSVKNENTGGEEKPYPQYPFHREGGKQSVKDENIGGEEENIFCPSCGGKLRVERFIDHYGRERYDVHCSNCDFFQENISKFSLDWIKERGKRYREESEGRFKEKLMKLGFIEREKKEKDGKVEVVERITAPEDVQERIRKVVEAELEAGEDEEKLKRLLTGVYKEELEKIRDKGILKKMKDREERKKFIRELRRQIFGERVKEWEEWLREMRAQSRLKREKIRRGKITGPIIRAIEAGETHVKGVVASLFIISLGIALAATFNIMKFVWGFSFLAVYLLIPDPKGWDPKSGEGYFGRKNAGNTGLAALKSVSKIGAFLFIGWAFLDFARTSFPLAPLIFITYVFFVYFSLPGKYDTEKPYEFMEALMRFLMGAVIIPFSIFVGIFHSWALAWLSLAFFAVFPKPRDEENLAAAIGRALSGAYQTYFAFDKLIFVILMMVGLAMTAGYIFLPLPFLKLLGGWGIKGAMLYTFMAVWTVSFIAGLFSPAEERPFTGIIMMGFAFVIFGLGPGSQNVGSALFGAWWPSLHNTAAEIFKPLGKIFSELQNTFGQSMFLLTNPVGYAQQIVEGSYVSHGDVSAGAYGLDIRNFRVDSIYPGEPFSISLEIENEGAFTAKNAKLLLLSTTDKIKMGEDTENMDRPKFMERGEYNAKLYGKEFDLGDVESKDIRAKLFFGSMSCEDAEDLMNKYITIYAKLTYDYEVHSSFQLKFLSENEWKKRARDETLVRYNVLSKITPSPAKLSLGSVDQPVKEKTPFYIGFTMNTSGGKIGHAKVYLDLPEDGAFSNPSCSKQPIVANTDTNDLVFEFGDNEAKQVFCMFKGVKVKDMGVPEKTYTILANATYNYTVTESRDTLVNFKSACRKEIFTKKVGPPLEGNIVITSKYGWRILGSKPDFHPGIDIRAGEGTGVISSTSGKVVKVENNCKEHKINCVENREAEECKCGKGFGNHVVVKSEIMGKDYYFIYAHLKDVKVNADDEVDIGDTIGTVGGTGFETGPHLHFQVSKDLSMKEESSINPCEFFFTEEEKEKCESTCTDINNEPKLENGEMKC